LVEKVIVLDSQDKYENKEIPVSAVLAGDEYLKNAPERIDCDKSLD